MGRKNTSKSILYLQYAAARAAAFAFRALPLRLAVGLGKVIGSGFYRVDRRHRLRVIEQIREALQVTEEEAASIAPRVYEHFGIMLAEFVRIPALTPEAIEERVDWKESLPVFRELLASGKGAIIATGHIGNWELTGSIMALKGLSTGAIARPLDNPYLDRYVKQVRSISGQEIWDKFGALRSAVRVLRDGKMFAILTDQDGGQDGVFLPFFGRIGSTIPTAADLSLRTGAPIIAGGIQRAGAPMRSVVNIRSPLFPDLEADPATERIRLLTAINNDLESIIRDAPEQWLWMHRRWKTQPRQ